MNVKPVGAVRRVIVELGAERELFTSSDVAERAQVSRQTAHRHLSLMVGRGELDAIGERRGRRYRARPLFVARRRRAGLREDEVWAEVAQLPAISALPSNVHSILRHSLTEIVNNAVDHSRSPEVAIEVAIRLGRVSFIVADTGIGIFEDVRQGRQLRTELEATAELQKGKVTTKPSAHAGEGIFFVSKMADRLVIESHAIRWVIDNEREDQALETIPPIEGTRVAFEIARSSTRILREVFQRYQVGRKFAKTKTAIHLFAEGGEFVSRSEAKRLVAGLEDFQEVELDFSKVAGIGQGFADEVFRVWQREHPGTKLVPTNLSPAVAFMVERVADLAPDR